MEFTAAGTAPVLHRIPFSASVLSRSQGLHHERLKVVEKFPRRIVRALQCQGFYPEGGSASGRKSQQGLGGQIAHQFILGVGATAQAQQRGIKTPNTRVPCRIQKSVA